MKCQEFTEFKIGSAYRIKKRMYFYPQLGAITSRLMLNPNSSFLVVDIIEATEESEWIEGLTFGGTVIWYHHTKMFQLTKEPISMKEILEEICS